MDGDSQDSSSEEKDIKPFIFPITVASTRNTNTNPIGLSPSFASSSKKWSPVSLQDSNRKSAFQPYKQASCTVLTNLQRGNTQAETPVPRYNEIDYHIRAGQGEITEQEVKNESSVDVRCSKGLTALHWAAAYGQYQTVQMLLSLGAEVDALGPEEETALLLAASGGHHEIVRLLITQGRANVNHEDHLINTALIYAAKNNHPHCCQELLQNGAEFVNVNFNDLTPYEVAMNNKSTDAQAVIEKFIIQRLEGKLNMQM